VSCAEYKKGEDHLYLFVKKIGVPKNPWTPEGVRFKNSHRESERRGIEEGGVEQPRRQSLYNKNVTLQADH